jgi:putative ABC transport system permease protein
VFVRTMLETLSHLFRHPVRTLLTITGLVVGIFALVLIGSLGETILSALAAEQEASFGTYTIRQTRWERPLTPATRREVRRVPGVAGTVTTLWSRLADPEEEDTVNGPVAEGLWAADSDLPGLAYGPPLVATPLLEGRLPAPGATNEVLLDFDLAQARGWAVGDTVPIRGRPFVVTGILERTTLGGERNAYLDYGTLQAMLRLPADYLPRLEAIAEPGQDPAELAARIEAEVPGVSVVTPEQKRRENQQGFGLLGAIAGVSVGLALLAGTLTVVNTMQMSVREREHEIGLKKALGAGDGDVLLEFLLEAGTLGALGGGLAALLAWFVVLGTNPVTGARWGLHLFRLTPRLALGAVALSSLLGALAGAYPAWRAARKDPVQALRNAPEVAYAESGLKRLLYLVGRRARWLLTMGGISAGILILTVSLSLAEFLNSYTASAVEATHDRVGLHLHREPRMAFVTAVRELERVEGVRGVVIMAYGGRLWEEGEERVGLFQQVPMLQGIDSPALPCPAGRPSTGAASWRPTASTRSSSVPGWLTAWASTWATCWPSAAAISPWSVSGRRFPGLFSRATTSTPTSPWPACGRWTPASPSIPT